MHFLIDASLPRAAAILLRELGHEATDVRDAGMSDAADDTIAAYARRNRLVLITRDLDFADIRNYLRRSMREYSCSSFGNTLRRHRSRKFCRPLSVAMIG